MRGQKTVRSGASTLHGVKIRGIFLSLALLLAVTHPALAAASPKAGGVCSTKGKSVVLNGKKFTCQLTKGKLKWSNGVPIAKSPVSPVLPAKKNLSLDNLDVDLVYEKSRAVIQEAISKGTLERVGINYFIGTNVEPARIATAKKEVESAARLWAAVFQPSELNVIWYSSQDLQWASDKYKELSGFPNPRINGANCTPIYCGNASATTGTSNNKFVFEQGLEFADQGLWNRSTAAHEYSHLAQASLAKDAGITLHFGQSKVAPSFMEKLSVTFLSMQVRRLDVECIHSMRKMPPSTFIPCTQRLLLSRCCEATTFRSFAH